MGDVDSDVFSYENGGVMPAFALKEKEKDGEKDDENEEKTAEP